jgi:Domain of unknown function (DUF4261)
MTRDFIRLTLFIPGTQPSLPAWNAALQHAGLHIDGDVLKGERLTSKVEVDWVENDGGFGAAFCFGTVSDEIVRRIDDAPAALILQWHADLREGRQEITSVVERLHGAGALAVRIEQSKLGWETSRWLELFSAEDPWSWHRGTVGFVGDGQTLQSCGMHAFSLPDVFVEVDGDASELQHFASVLNVYQIEEDPVMLSGQTFSPDRDTPRRVVERWPDTRYPSDHLCHNPYGVWRLGPAGGTARPQPELALVFIPALCPILMALERDSGRPLTQHEVEDTRDKAVCMAMQHRIAQQMERSRGYADLNPELAWEQWQLVRHAPPNERG